MILLTFVFSRIFCLMGFFRIKKNDSEVLGDFKGFFRISWDF